MSKKNKKNKRKGRRHHKPTANPCVNYKTLFEAVEGRVSHFLDIQLQKILEDGRGLNLAMDAAVHLHEDTNKRCAFLCGQTDEE